MQTKKEDMQQRILAVARQEFVIHSYENSSMRTIAKKANTSIGNIYHYYPNKEALLDALLTPTVLALHQLVLHHLKLNIQIQNMDEINQFLDEVDIESTEMKALLSKEFVIFVQTDVKKYVEERQRFMDAFHQHVAWHMNIKNKDNHFISIICNMMVDCFVHLNKCDTCWKQQKEDFIKLVRMLCSGLIVNEEPNEELYTTLLKHKEDEKE